MRTVDREGAKSKPHLGVNQDGVGVISPRKGWVSYSTQPGFLLQ